VHFQRGEGQQEQGFQVQGKTYFAVASQGSEGGADGRSPVRCSAAAGQHAGHAKAAGS